MGKAKKTPPTEVSGSEARQRGRKLTLIFDGDELPVLARIQFRAQLNADETFLERDHPLKGSAFEWAAVAQALSLLFLKYVLWDKNGRPDVFRFSGTNRESLAASLGDAFYKDNPFHELFAGISAHQKNMLAVFRGDNLAGRSPTKPHRHITVSEVALPPDCVEIIWKQRGGKPLAKIGDFQRLEDQIRRAWNLPPEPAIPVGEASEPAKPSMTPVPEPKQEEEPLPKPEPEQSEPSTGPKTKPKKGKSSQSNPASPEPETAQAGEPATPPPEAFSPPTGSKRSKAEPLFATDLTDEAEAKEQAKAAPASATTEPSQSDWTLPEYTPPPIDRNLFCVTPTDHQWPDDSPLIGWGDDDNPHVWTLKNAFEGVLVMGATGSGKTSGSGVTLAEAFLRSGFGGLILTVKTNEAEHWRRLCAHCGREKDFVVVRRGGEWKLNLLAYEAQRPGQGSGLAKNLVAFCRNLLSVSSRTQGGGMNEQFWQSATDQLLGATFDLFLLAGGNITFDRLADFVAAAPTENVPASESAWLKVPLFGDVFGRARRNVGSTEDMRLLKRAMDYWFRIYPGLASKTRTSITLGVFALLDTFRGRDVPDIISSDTNLTPESIMSGKIVVLDLPVKEFGQTGLLVQSAWKYLFQMALERQANAGNPKRRPVFLWEDEGQYFFSEHDHHFQDTARSARVCRVILSQNLHNFYKEFGEAGGAAANSVFGNLNTKIFHANSDPTTNEWAAKHFGQEIHTRLTISHNPPPPQQPKDMADSLWQAFNPPNTAGISTTEHWEYAVRPEEFNALRTGGPENDFQVDAFITWVGASTDGQRHFTFITFNQNPDL